MERIDNLMLAAFSSGLGLGRRHMKIHSREWWRMVGACRLFRKLPKILLIPLKTRPKAKRYSKLPGTTVLTVYSTLRLHLQ